MQRSSTPGLRSNKDWELKTRSLEAPLYHDDDDDDHITYITGGANDPPPSFMMMMNITSQISQKVQTDRGSRFTSKSSRVCTHGLPECRIEPYCE
jgi:hypothetical protein